MSLTRFLYEMHIIAIILLFPVYKVIASSVDDNKITRTIGSGVSISIFIEFVYLPSFPIKLSWKIRDENSVRNFQGRHGSG